MSSPPPLLAKKKDSINLKPRHKESECYGDAPIDKQEGFAQRILLSKTSTGEDPFKKGHSRMTLITRVKKRKARRPGKLVNGFFKRNPMRESASPHKRETSRRSRSVSKKSGE